MKKLVGLTAAVLILTGCAKEPAGLLENVSVRSHLTVAFSGKPEFQPHSADNPSMGFCLGMIYEPLWEFKENGTIVPVLAEKIVNRGREVDIYLAEGKNWHDGTKFGPEDVVYTISLITNGESVYPKGIISSAKQTGKNRVTVSLSAAYWEPERLFTFPIVKNGSPLHMKEPVGTGMYKFCGKGGFDTYLFEPVDKEGFPDLKMIHVRSHARETELFKAGLTDVQFVDNYNITDYIPLKNCKMIKYPTNHIVYIGINAKSLPAHFRRALFYALDTEHMAEEIYGSSAKAVSVPYLSENSFSYKHMRNLPLSRSELKAGNFRSETNKSLVVTIGVKAGEGHGKVAEAVSAAMAEMGILCVIKEWNFESADNYDLVVATQTTQSLLEQNPELLSHGISQYEFNNRMFSKIPFIPVAMRCNGIFISHLYDDKIPFDLPLFFGKSGILN